VIASFTKSGPLNLITDVAGITVGNTEDCHAATGVTVVLPEDRAVAGMDSRGGAPGSRETDALNPENLVEAVDAIVLAGGSSYGLDAASGVANWLGTQNRGFRMGSSPMVSPVVPAAILFDLTNGGDKSWGDEPPYRQLGRKACLDASGGAFPLGNAGAGYGAIAGSYKGGLGSASAVTDGGIMVGALVAANPFGSPVIPGTDCFWAGPFEHDREFGGATRKGGAIPNRDVFADTKAAGRGPGQNTTIGVVATNVSLTPAQARRIAIMAQDGIARAVRPAHTPMDGDTLFVLSTAKIACDEPAPMTLSLIGAVAADCVARAIARGVYEARSLFQTPSYGERHGR